jgi:uncharacterized membrane protein YdjX (TVP38/TMEM64 family)
MSTEIFKNNKSSFLLLLVMVVLPVSVSSVSMFFLSEYENDILNFSFTEWILFYLFTAFTMSFALTPTTFIALVSGYFLGWTSLTGLVPSYIIASLIGFYFAGWFDKGKFLSQLKENKKVSGIMENLKTDELWVIFFCRLSPALPFAMMNVFLSFMKVKMKNFISGSILGMLPRTLLSVWIGTQASDIMKMLKGTQEPDSGKILVIALLLSSVIGLYVLFMRAVKKYKT